MSFGLDRIAERKISEAIEEGKFNDLDGKGRPLNLEEDPLTPPHLRLGNRILRNANVRPDWVQMDVDIRSSRLACEALRKRIASDYVRIKERACSKGTDQAERLFAEWYVRRRGEYLGALKAHNDAILKYNLAAPNSPSVFIPFKMAEESSAFDTEFPAPPGVEWVVERGDQDTSGTIRDSTAALYAAGLTKGP